ncbi:RES domain-containing protein [Demequina globuliformis]|uniref:RES domain-containing protein n=1 Tax=Demequina globuliformis TaxID=676202 RepID=UPI0007815D46|nr:RES domain-containing protein [Demequina globuliformis]
MGPLPTRRWDPHRPTAINQPDRAVLYAATTLATAVAEAFQSLRYIDTVSGDPWIFTFTPTRPLRLLNIEGSWAVRNGAAAALAHGDKRITRAWTREVFVQQPGLDGVWAPSTLVGETVTLFSDGIAAMPVRAHQSIAADDPAARVVLEEIADQIGYRI